MKQKDAFGVKVSVVIPLDLAVEVDVFARGCKGGVQEAVETLLRDAINTRKAVRK